jgi:amino acid adenylation domain-containing protein
MGAWYAFSADDVAAHSSAVGFALGKRVSFMLCVLNGGSVWAVAEADANALLRAIEDDRVTYVPATYSMHRELLARMAGRAPLRSPRLRFMSVSSGALDAHEMDELEAAFGVPAVSIYGATEIGNAMMQPLDRARRTSGSAGYPVGAEVRLVGDHGVVDAVDEVGEIQVRGPQVIARYFDEPALDREAFVDGWFRTGDLGSRDARGEYFVSGRLNDLVNRGGEKLSPARLDSVLRTMPGVADAASFGVPHPRLGQEIVAAVVRAPGATTSAGDVRAHVSARLGVRYAPRRVWFVDALPRTATGKVRRAALAEHVGFDGASMIEAGEVDASPPSPLEVALGALWAAALRVAKVDRDADFFMLGGDSLRGASLLEQVQAVFGVALPVQALFDDAGTVASMARRIERERAGRRRPDAPAPIPRRQPGEPIPLSHAQARAWFLYRLDSTSDAYHESRLWHLDGEFDVEALRRALALVAERQAVLRTRYVVVQGEPRQIVGAASDVVLEVVELGETGEARLEAAVAERMSRPFDLAGAPPVRFALFRLGPRRHALLRVWHHIMNDGISAGIFQDDLSEAYAAVRAGRAPAWTPLPVEYADFAAWQRRTLGGDALDAAVATWKRKLAGLPTLALPADRARPAAQSFHGGVLSQRLPSGATDALKALARNHGATPFMAFLAVYAALLARLSGDEDIPIGTPVAGRARAELARLVGFFANTLVIRADLTGSPSFADALERTRDTVLDALERQDVPFERLVEALGVARDPSRNPLFQVAFTMRESDARELAFDGVAVRRDAGRHGRAKFDLTLSLVDAADGVSAHWEYCADLFDASTIERMAHQYAKLIAAFAAAPAAPLHAPSLLDEATRRRVVVDANRTATAFPSTTTVHARVAGEAAAHPRAIAIGGLDYASLDARANRLAHALVAAGVGPRTFVGVARAKPADIAIAWLAVLKAGAAYVPIDLELPAERIAFVLSDARIAVVVADDVAASRFAAHRVGVVCPDAEAAKLAALPGTPPAVDTGPEDAAYAIYTSGSTGLPKGVVVPHRAVLRLVCDTDYVRLGEGDVVAQLANPAFDASTFEFWGAFCNGARLAPIAKMTALQARALAAALAAEKVSAMFITSSLFNATAREAPSAFASVATVLVGGEALEPRWIREVLRAGPPGRLINGYGPTETTTFACCHVIDDVPADAAGIPIGRPIANTEAFVLGPGGEPCAIGEPGELYIGGPGVALGYLDRPELTAARFVERTIAPLPPRRLYATGDRVRLREDLAIEFLGRRDRQVKVRGHRIELDEVESALARLPAVAAAAVELRGDTAETRQVVAYLVPSDPAAPPPAQLLRELRRTLPEYMLPGAIVWMPALPLTPSGKLDRRALPLPADATRPGGDIQVWARDTLEGTLARIWGQVLGHDQIGVFDHFFEIGGHSLLAARLVDAIERETGFAVPLTSMFADDTIAGMARAMREGAPPEVEPILTMNAQGSRPPFVYLHGDFTGGGFYSRTMANALGADQPVLIVHPHGLVEDAIPPTIEAMASDRLVSLRALQPRGPYLIGGHCNGALVAYEMARQLAAAGESVPAVVLIDARAPEARDDDGGDDGDAPFLRINAAGGPQVMQARDRLSDAELRYAKAMHAYAGRPYDGHVVIVKAREFNRATSSDMGWSRLAPSIETHEVAGTHGTMLTRHLGELAATIRGALERATGVNA